MRNDHSSLQVSSVSLSDLSPETRAGAPVSEGGEAAGRGEPAAPASPSSVPLHLRGAAGGPG